MTDFERKRLSVGLSQTEIARKVGVDPSTVSRWEAGETTPQPACFPKLAEIFGMTAEEVTHLFDAPAESKPDRQSLEGEPPPSVAPAADTIPA